MVWKKKHKLSESCVAGTIVNSNKRRKEDEPKPKLKADDIYYEENGLQRIHPYYHKYATHAKGRWVGRTIYDVFAKEFRDRQPSYYEAAIRQGLIELNGQKVDKTTVVRNGDLVTHYIHRHEPPVARAPVRVVNETSELYIVDKPASVPVHPSGRYNYNSVIRILEIKQGREDLFPINRLDRLTSGLMLIARNAEAARRMEKHFVEHRIQKEYICKVQGEFPLGKIVCDQAIRVVAHKLSLNCVDPKDGKPSLTEFERLSSDGETSIVYCRPKTGRTHQIRVHLQFLGHPIANDPLYCNEAVWGKQMGRRGHLPTDEEEVVEEEEEEEEEEEKVVVAGRPSKMAGKRDSDKQNEAWVPLVRRMEEWKSKQELVDQVNGAEELENRLCEKCASPAYPDPTEEELAIWLHAWRYSGPGWTYETPLPAWAQEAEAHIDRVKYVPE
ncbi:DRAP deaminase [Coemansia sp. RSA 1358]|nr:DRAP deaminase [Coemansia sp. RSA 1358]